jgi:DNA-binding CsgD family transcriptional regulator
LSRHSAQAKEVAELLSVFPAGTTWEELEHLNPFASPALEELENGGWLESTGSYIGFRHELLRRAVEESLSSVRRRELNRDVLDFLTTSGADPATLAHHAEQAGDTQRFLEHTVGAARAFSRAGAHRDALTHLLRVEQHSSLLPDVDEARFAEALGVELMVGDRASEARSRLVTASERWKRLGDVDSQARALAETSKASRRLGDVDRSVDELQQALDLLDGSTDRDLVVKTRTNMAQLVGTQSRWAEALAQVEIAMPDAVAIGAQSLAMALGIRGNARRILGDDVAGRSDHLSAIELAMREGKEVVVMTAHMNRVAASLGTLDLGSIDDELTGALSFSHEIQAEYARSILKGHRCYLRELRGEWDAALESSSGIIEAEGDPLAMIRPRLVLGTIRVRRGDDSGLGLMLQAHRDARTTRDIQRIGHTAAALAEMHWLGKVSSPNEVLDAAVVATTGGHVRHAAELALWCRRLGLVGPGPPATGPEAILAELDGDWRSAASRWHEMGLPYYRALTLAFSDDADAMTQAVVEATKLGASTTADRIRARLRELGHRVSRGPGTATLSNPAGLTNRQLEVLELVAAGFTNHEIADRLYISPKTVEHHVSAILTRLGSSDRREAGLWAIESGAVPSSHPNMGNGPR